METFVKSTEERWNFDGGPSWLFPELSRFMAAKANGYRLSGKQTNKQVYLNTIQHRVVQQLK